MALQISILGVSDAGKTTIVEKLIDKKLSKYRAESSSGMTMKMNYGQFKIGDGAYYIFDSPGHKSYCLETLRTVDLADIILYIADASSARGTGEYLQAIEHYRVTTTLLERMDKLVITCFNKAELRSDEELERMYDDYCSVFSAACTLPISGKIPNGLVALEAKLAEIDPQKLISNRVQPPESVIARVIKSYNVNKTGVVLDRVRGGVVGVYKHRKIDPSRSLSMSNVFCEDVTRLAIESIIDNNDQIATIETKGDPTLYKNDFQKGAIIYDYDLLKYQNFCEGSLSLTTNMKSLSKGERITLLLFGQELSLVVKKLHTSKRETVVDCGIEKVRNKVIAPIGASGILIAGNKSHEAWSLDVAVITSG